LLITTLQQLPSPNNRTLVLNIITVFLHKSKVSILELMKSMPNVHIAEEEQFIVWQLMRCTMTCKTRESGSCGSEDANAGRATLLT
jgi:hypothetical protein